MSVLVKFPYKLSAVNLFFRVLNDVGEDLRSDLGTFEIWQAPNDALYKTPLTMIVNSDGIFQGIIPNIDVSLLPIDITIYIYDPILVAEFQAPIGQGRVRIGRDNNEQPDAKLLYLIHAATVGRTQGVGTLAEEYYGYDDFLGFTTTFDTAGNRIVVVE